MSAGVDLSQTLSNVFTQLISWITSLLDMLDNIYIFPHVSLLVFLVSIVVIGMIISSVFVLFDGGVDDDD